jgi:thiol:disulfide interchange protein DsbC
MITSTEHYNLNKRYAMRHFTKGLAILLFAISLAAVADDSYNIVENRIRSLAPHASTIAISETPIDGILQVQINGDIVYTTADGKFLFQGRILDLDTREDLTEASKAGLRKELMVNIDAASQISFSPEEPVHNLTVFTDIDCGYCRKLHAQVAEYNKQGIAIHYMSFPRAGVGSRSYEKAVSVWCANDQQTAMTQAKLGAEPEPHQCDNPVAEQYQLGVDLGVTGTPALLTGDGLLIPGYIPPEKLRVRLDQLVSVPVAD